MKRKNILLSLMLAFTMAFLGFGMGEALGGGKLCLDLSGGEYDYMMSFDDVDGKWEVNGYLAYGGTEQLATCSGTAYVNGAGDIIIGMNTVWAWTTGGYTDPTSVVYINLTDGTYDVTYIPLNRAFQGTVAIIPCGTFGTTDGGTGNNNR
ncbi:hypothetical protein [Petrachloros mirabilis]